MFKPCSKNVPKTEEHNGLGKTSLENENNKKKSTYEHCNVPKAGKNCFNDPFMCFSGKSLFGVARICFLGKQILKKWGNIFLGKLTYKKYASW
jgi:hypothetical protein